MSFGISSSVMPTASFAAILAIGKSGGLARERGAARDARIHFDHSHAAGLGIDGELDVRAARLDADFADDRGGCVAHALIFLVGKRLRGRDGDRIARVDAHRDRNFRSSRSRRSCRESRASLRARIPSSRSRIPRSAPGGRARVESARDGVRQIPHGCRRSSRRCRRA